MRQGMGGFSKVLLVSVAPCATSCDHALRLKLQLPFHPPSFSSSAPYSRVFYHSFSHTVVRCWERCPGSKPRAVLALGGGPPLEAEPYLMVLSVQGFRFGFRD